MSPYGAGYGGKGSMPFRKRCPCCRDLPKCARAREKADTQREIAESMTGASDLTDSPGSEYDQPATNDDANEPPQERTLIPVRDEVMGSFEEMFLTGAGHIELLGHYLDCALHQLKLLLAKPEGASEGTHFIFFCEEETPYTGKVVFRARICECVMRNGRCWDEGYNSASVTRAAA